MKIDSRRNSGLTEEEYSDMYKKQPPILVWLVFAVGMIVVGYYFIR